MIKRGLIGEAQHTETWTNKCAGHHAHCVLFEAQCSVFCADPRKATKFSHSSLKAYKGVILQQLKTEATQAEQNETSQLTTTKVTAMGAKHQIQLHPSASDQQKELLKRTKHDEQLILWGQIPGEEITFKSKVESTEFIRATAYQKQWAQRNSTNKNQKVFLGRMLTAEQHRSPQACLMRSPCWTTNQKESKAGH